MLKFKRPARGAAAVSRAGATCRATSSSTPVPASIEIFLTASGLVLATSSISTPPSTETMHR